MVHTAIGFERYLVKTSARVPTKTAEPPAMSRLERVGCRLTLHDMPFDKTDLAVGRIGDGRIVSHHDYS